jgi:predicted secreted hydrolase
MKLFKSKTAPACRHPRVCFTHLLLWCLRMFTHGHAEEWQQAQANYELKFPADHGSHLNHRIEWWYFTGNVATADGHAFGYQLTFFRIGTDLKPANPSVWSVRDLHMAHVAISDLTNEKYYCAQRLSRSGPGLAGAQPGDGADPPPRPVRIWNGAWQAELKQDTISLSASGQDGVQDFKLDLQLVPRGPLVKHGENGYSRKGQQPGNASLYYSFTRLPTAGMLTIGSEKFPVTGVSWMDHEFGTSFLEAGQVGWDWFALQLDDGSDLMLFQMRNLLPSAPKTMSGTLINPDGTITKLAPGDMRLKASELWQSSTTGGRYPLKWEIKLPNQAGGLTVTTKLQTQEMHGAQTGPSYWEGAVEAVGTLHGHATKGRGYLEMTGYSASMASFFSMSDH